MNRSKPRHKKPAHMANRDQTPATGFIKDVKSAGVGLGITAAVFAGLSLLYLVMTSRTGSAVVSVVFGTMFPPGSLYYVESYLPLEICFYVCGHIFLLCISHSVSDEGQTAFVGGLMKVLAAYFPITLFIGYLSYPVHEAVLIAVMILYFVVRRRRPSDG